MFRASCATSVSVSLSRRSVAKVAAKASARMRFGLSRLGLSRFGLAIKFCACLVRDVIRFELVRMRSGAIQSGPCKRASSLGELAVLGNCSCVDSIVAFIIAIAIAGPSGCVCRLS